MIGKLIDAAVKAPGQIVEAAAETVTRLPEVPIRMVEAAVRGADRGLDRVGDALDGEDRR